MFHSSDNLYFGRTEDGSVRILKLPSVPVSPPTATGFYPEALFDALVSPTIWASIMAAVSLRGEVEGRFYVAQAFHMNFLGQLFDQVSCIFLI